VKRPILSIKRISSPSLKTYFVNEEAALTSGEAHFVSTDVFFCQSNEDQTCHKGKTNSGAKITKNGKKM
jgi:hypothetical protein